MSLCAALFGIISESIPKSRTVFLQLEQPPTFCCRDLLPLSRGSRREVQQCSWVMGSQIRWSRMRLSAELSAGQPKSHLPQTQMYKLSFHSTLMQVLKRKERRMEGAGREMQTEGGHIESGRLILWLGRRHSNWNWLSYFFHSAKEARKKESQCMIRRDRFTQRFFTYLSSTPQF